MLGRILCPLALFFALHPSPAIADQPDPEPDLTETVTVTAARHPTEPEIIEALPAHVTILDRERIERSGARTLQDLLALECGVVLYDEVGNDIQKTLDFRGFSQGSGTKVFLDGAPLNDTRNNSLALDLIPLSALERIEISRGSTAALAGGGSEAAVVHLVTRSGEAGGLGGSLSASSGTFDTSDFAGEIHSGTERFDFFFSGSEFESAGFRENAGGDVRRLSGSVGVDLGHERRLALSAVDSTSDLGNPGALTARELDSDPRAAPFNRLDFSEEELRQTSLNYRGPLGGAFSLAANLFARDRASEILSTGRSAEVFGGFFLDSDASALGSTVQLTHDFESTSNENLLVFGVEWLDGDTDARGFFTPPSDPGVIDLSSPASDNTTERSTTAFYAQDSWEPTPNLTLLAGARADRDRVEYQDASNPALSDSRDFSEVSLRAGASFLASDHHAFHLSYGEGFLPPTAEELFSFPLFFSNPDLEPEDSRSYEVGYRGRFSQDVRLDVALFEIDTIDEIVFVPDPLPKFTGRNRNVGETRRRGVEVALRGRPLACLRAFANVTFVDSEFREGQNRGNTVPLVPRTRVAAGVDADLPGNVTLRVDVLHVGEQVLDNDPANAEAELEAYTVANARVSWSFEHLRLFAEARNLLDEEYATRAIFAGDAFFTPAPGRRYLAGASWLF